MARLTDAMLRCTVGCRQFFDERRRDPHRLERGVIRQHRDHHFRIERLFRALRHRRTARTQRFGDGSRAVPHHEVMAAVEQPRCHAAAHLAQSDESDFHCVIFL